MPEVRSISPLSTSATVPPLPEMVPLLTSVPLTVSVPPPSKYWPVLPMVRVVTVFCAAALLEAARGSGTVADAFRGGRQPAAAAEGIGAVAAGVVAEVKSVGNGVGPGGLRERPRAGIAEVLVGCAQPAGTHVGRPEPVASPR